MSENNWKGIMPMLPLAVSVPVIHSNGVHGTVCRIGGPARWSIGTDRTGYVEINSAVYGTVWRYLETVTACEREHMPSLRVDLDDPQGFAYALRWLTMWQDSAPHQACLRTTEYPAVLGNGIRERWAADRTTDADRYELARACAEAVKRSAV